MPLFRRRRKAETLAPPPRVEAPSRLEPLINRLERLVSSFQDAVQSVVTTSREIETKTSVNARDTLGTEQILAKLEALGAQLDATPSQPPPAPVASAPAATVVEDLGLDPDKIDDRFAMIIRDFVGRAPSSKVSGVLVDVTILGPLRNGAIAWVNQDLRIWGTLSRELLGDMDPQIDDTVRALVVSYPWGHLVNAVVPFSLVSPFATRPVDVDTPPQDSGIPLLVRGTAWEKLRPGEIVLTRIPYDGSHGLNRDGRIAKNRPAVFVRWGEDYAWMRAIYDRDSYVGREGLGIRLVDSSCLDKPSVVRNAEFDIDPGNLVRGIGRLGPRDLLALNIDDSTADATPPTLVRPEFSTREDRDPVDREIPALISAVRATATDSPDALASRMLAAFRANPAVRAVLETHGVHLAMVGHVFATIARSAGVPVPKGTFRPSLTVAMEADTPDEPGEYVLRFDENNHPMLWLGERGPGETPNSREPIDRPIPVVAPLIDPRFVLDEDYAVPDIIIYDQEAAALVVRDARVDLRQSLIDLRAGGDAPGYILGSDSQFGWASFQDAARKKGWKTIVTSDREDVCARATRLALDVAAETVTIIGYMTDLISEIENNGHETNIISAID